MKIGKKNFSSGEIVGLVIVAIVLWICVAMLIALPVNWSMKRFGASWSDYWAWVCMIAVLPAIRLWTFGK